MESLIKHLAQARKIQQEYKAELDELNAEIVERYGKRSKRIMSLLATAKADVKDAERDVREAAVAAHHHDGSKKPHEAVQVKMYTTLAYEPDDAIEYCIKALPNALKLDKRAFEKVAKVARPNFCDIRQEPRTTIARDLEKYLSGVLDAADNS